MCMAARRTCLYRMVIATKYIAKRTRYSLHLANGNANYFKFCRLCQGDGRRALEVRQRGGTYSRRNHRSAHSAAGELAQPYKPSTRYMRRRTHRCRDLRELTPYVTGCPPFVCWDPCLQEVAELPEGEAYEFRLMAGQTIKLEQDGSFSLDGVKCWGDSFMGVAAC